MTKSSDFPSGRGMFWPTPATISPYFLDPHLSNELWSGSGDSWGLKIYGAHGTAHLPPYGVIGGKGIGSAIEVHLTLWANPKFGVLVMYDKYGGGADETHYSKGDLSRLKEWVRTKYDDLRPVGLYIPLEKAWPAIKEFMETEGDLPKSIPWLRPEELPKGTFPDPWEHPEVT